MQKPRIYRRTWFLVFRRRTQLLYTASRQSNTYSVTHSLLREVEFATIVCLSFYQIPSTARRG